LNKQDASIANILTECASILELKASMKGLKLTVTLSSNFQDNI